MSHSKTFRCDTLKEFIDSQRKTDHLDKALLAFKVNKFEDNILLYCDTIQPH